MSWSLKLFKAKGIEVKVHITFLLILVWAAWRWSAGTSQGLRGPLFGVVVTVLLFVAVTLHELGHSFQALHYGVAVDGITLLPLGGVAQSADMPEDPDQELRIALAGPVVNIVIAAVLVGAGLALDARAVISLSELMAALGDASWQGLLAYLTMTNVALAAFNLIPAFPMDGGRVLRALLAMRMDAEKATSIVTRSGQGLALALGLWGFMQGSWTLVLIAIFVWMGASQESQSTLTQEAMDDLTVGQLEPYTLRLAGLHEISQAILAAEQPRTIAQSALQHLCRLASCDRAGVGLFDFDRGTIEVLVAQGSGGARLGSGTRRPMEDCPITAGQPRQTELRKVDDTEALANPSSIEQALIEAGIRSYISVPLIVKEEVIGVLNLGYEQPTDFAEGQIDVACQVADSLALALQQARTLEAEREQRALAETLRDTTAALNSTLDLDEVLDRILRSTERLVPHGGANIMLIEGSGAVRVAKHCPCYEAHGLSLPDIPPGTTVADLPLLREMAQARQPLVIPDVGAHPGWSDHPGSEWVRSYLGTLILVGEEVAGFINLGGAVVGAFSAADTEVLAALANQAAIAIGNARLYAELTRRSEDLEYTNSLLRTMNRAASRLNIFELDEILDHLVDELGALGFTCVVAVREGDTSDLIIERHSIKSAVVSQVEKLIGFSLLGYRIPYQALKEEALANLLQGDLSSMIVVDPLDIISIIVPHLQRTMIRQSNQILGITEDTDVALLPLRIRGELKGFIATWKELLLSDELLSLEVLAEHVAVAIHNAELYDELEAYSVYLEQAIEERTAELKESEARYRNAFEHAAVGIAHVAPDGTFLSVNQRLGEIVGYTRDELLEMSFQDITHPDDLKAELAYIQQMLDGEIDTYNMEKRYICKDATTVWASLTASLLREPSGAPRYFISVIGDITRRRQAEAALRKSQQGLQGLFDNATDAFLIANDEGQCIEVNPAACSLLGYGHEELLELSVWDLSPALDQKMGREWWQDLIAGGQQRGEYEAERQDGTTIEVEYQAAANIIPGEHLMVLRDVSERKELERMKDEFLSTAAHELRTPLTSMMGFSEILLTRQLDQERRKRYLTMINKQSVQLKRIIDDLLDISKLEAGQGLDIQRELVTINELIDDVIQPYIDTAPDHMIRVEGVEKVPPVNGDPFRLTQVIRNLMSNAVKYSPAGGTVTIRAQVMERHLAISVQDEGIGLTQEQQPHAFEKFYRAETMATDVGGTGLGLAICKLIVEQHGGQIWVESMPGEGSTFTFTVPLAEVGNGG